MKSHNDLTVYQKSLDLVETIYSVTNDFPSDEKFGITSQIRRSVVSVPSNIAEGAGRQSKKEFSRFLYISLGSLAETETLIKLSNRLKFISDPIQIEEEIIHIRRMLLKLIKSLDQK